MIAPPTPNVTVSRLAKSSALGRAAAPGVWARAGAERQIAARPQSPTLFICAPPPNSPVQRFVDATVPRRRLVAGALGDQQHRPRVRRAMRHQLLIFGRIVEALCR